MLVLEMEAKQNLLLLLVLMLLLVVLEMENGSQTEPHATVGADAAPGGAGSGTQTEPIAKRRKANKKAIASSETVVSSQPITRSKVSKEITRGVTMSQPVTRSKRRLLYKGSSSRHLAPNDENMAAVQEVPDENVTIAQLVSDYMSMMETWKKEAKKKGLKIIGEDKNKGGGGGAKKGGKK
ncbi:hypothetical protein RIF29_34740 [Crotalaria pallida]|uniref:Uncharacterized protein n=1 Tax=Crotalaria pallida TaxID=3830 RepID=A0AAN9EEY9_CROPI